MKDSQRAHLEQRLLKERERAQKALRQLDETARAGTADDGELSTYPLHLADEGTDTIEQEKGLMLLSQEGRRLAEIDDALRRLYREPESFGRCEACGGDITFERLDVVPWTRLCVDCQERAETGGAETESGAATGGETEAGE
jgi:DnaK suppressor protein